MALSFPGDGRGGDVVALSGAAVARIGMSPESFAERYGVPVRIHLERVRGH